MQRSLFDLTDETEQEDQMTQPAPEPGPEPQVQEPPEDSAAPAEHPEIPNPRRPQRPSPRNLDV